MKTLKQEISASALGPARVSDEGVISRRFSFSPRFTGFSGHFPGYPILPAVVQVMAALVVAEEDAGSPLQATGVEKAKFSSEIKPDQDVEITCAKRNFAGGRGFDVRIMSGDKIAASFLVTCVSNGDL